MKVKNDGNMHDVRVKNFTVSSLIEILSNFPQDMDVHFGVHKENGSTWFHDQDFVYQIGEGFSREDQLRIITRDFNKKTKAKK